MQPAAYSKMPPKSPKPVGYDSEEQLGETSYILHTLSQRPKAFPRKALSMGELRVSKREGKRSWITAATSVERPRAAVDIHRLATGGNRVLTSPVLHSVLLLRTRTSKYTWEQVARGRE